MSFLDLLRSFRRGKPSPSAVPIYFFNTRGKEKQRFTLPHGVREVRMYNCGPTVYDVQHIGNLSMYVFADILRRLLEWNGLSVRQVVNITDVGHLSSDADTGEDKMSKGLKREGLKVSLENMNLLAEKYTAVFFGDLRKLNVDTKRVTFPRASDHIPAQIAMVKTLEEKGYAYVAEDGVYFDTKRFPNYGELGGVSETFSEKVARIDPKAKKHSSADFALWKFDKRLGWDSPWGKGFPGWHIECSAMIRATLGQQIDIHTGGIEHIPIHHNNEIAQSEAVTGRRPLSRFWIHRAHVQLEGEKVAKSKGNVVYLSDIAAKGCHPLALRYLFLGAHYRAPSNFTWGSLSAAEGALTSLYRAYATLSDKQGKGADPYRIRFRERINDDVDTPGALAVMWELVGDETVADAEKRSALDNFDEVLGIDISKGAEELARVPEEIIELSHKREFARSEKNWELADEIRSDIESRGFEIRDMGSGPPVILRRTLSS